MSTAGNANVYMQAWEWEVMVQGGYRGLVVRGSSAMMVQVDAPL